MSDAARIVLAPVSRAEADACVRHWHYSGKPYSKSQVHLGVLLDGELCGALQLGPPLDPWRVIGLVRDTPYNGMCELNRMALSPALPRNSESRALGILARLLRRHAPWIEWVLSFADERAGSGTIYRAAGWLLTGVRVSRTFWRLPSGEVVSDVGLRTSARYRRAAGVRSGSVVEWRAAGLQPYPLRQVRYVLPLHPTARERLTVPVLPYACARVAGAPAPPALDVRPDPQAPLLV